MNDKRSEKRVTMFLFKSLNIPWVAGDTEIASSKYTDEFPYG